MDGRWGTRDGRAAAAAACLVGLAAVVAITSRATAHGGGALLRAGPGSSHALGTVLLVTGLAVWAIGTAVLVVAFWPAGVRRRKRSPEDDAFEPYRPDAYRWERAVVLAVPLALLAGIVAAVVLVGGGGGTSAPTTTYLTAPGSATAAAPPAHPAPATPPAAGAPTAGVVAVAAAGAALLAGAVLVALRRRGRSGPKRRPVRARRDVAAALDWSLDDLRREPDPRRAVVAAYARMERLLGEHGVRRHRWEAPLEYLVRALARVRGGDASLAELTSLFHEARFSPHAVGEPERARAVEVLTTLREELEAE